MIQPSQIDRIWSERYVDVYNNTGSQLNKYKFVKPVGDYSTKSIPAVGLINDYTVYPTAFLIDDLPDTQSTDLQLSTIRALDRGRIQIIGLDTSLATPGVTKVFCDNNGNPTLTPTPFLVGVVLVAQVDGIVYLTISNGGSFETATATYRQSFQNANLLGGLLTVNHNLNLHYCAIQVYNNLNKLVIPDDVTLINAWTAQINLTSFGTITGSWNVVVIGTGTGIIPAPATILNGTGAPSPLLGNDEDFYIDTAVSDLYGPKTGGVWGSPTSLIGVAVPDATGLVKGKIKLAGDLSGTADLPVVKGIIKALATPPLTPLDGDSYFDTTLRCILTFDSTRNKWLSDDTTRISLALNGDMAAGISFNGPDGLPTSSSPIVIEDDMCLVGLVVKTVSPENWTLRIADIAPGGSGNLLTQVIDNGGGGSVSVFIKKDLNTNFNANDQLDAYIQALGSSLNIDRPSIQLILKKRK